MTNQHHWTDVQSSNLAAFAFEGYGEPPHDDGGDLLIRFTNGRTYRYFGVPMDVVEQIERNHENPDFSIGSWFAREIRRAFQYEEVT